MDFDNRKTIRIMCGNIWKLSIPRQKYSENLQGQQFPHSFLIYETPWIQIFLFLFHVIFFPTCLEMETAWALINSLKFSLVLLQSLCTSVHPSETPFVSSASPESHQTALSPYRKEDGSRVLHPGNGTDQAIKMAQFIILCWAPYKGFGNRVPGDLFLFCYPHDSFLAESFQRHIQGMSKV